MASVVSTLVLPLDDTGDGKVINRYFDNLEAAVPQAEIVAYSAANSVQSLSIDAAIDGGNYTITVTLRNGETFTTGSILYSANAATVEGALDSAATSASITGWTNGDISVSGGDISTAPVVLTFDGASVSGTNHPVAVANDVDIENATLGTITALSNGHPACPTLQLAGTQGPLVIPYVNDPSTWTRNTLVRAPAKSVLEWIAHTAVTETQNETAYDAVLSLFA